MNLVVLVLPVLMVLVLVPLAGTKVYHSRYTGTRPEMIGKSASQRLYFSKSYLILRPIISCMYLLRVTFKTLTDVREYRELRDNL